MPFSFAVSRRMDSVAGRGAVVMKVMPLTIPVGPSCALSPKVVQSQPLPSKDL